MRVKPHKYTDEQIKFVRNNIKGTPYRKMQELFNEKFNTEITYSQMKGFLARNKLTNGISAEFKKGHKSWNKGMKGLQLGGEAGWFKKGERPINYRPVGSERIDTKDGYVIVKVQDEGTYQERWRHKHVVEWEKHYGKVPDNHVVAFLDSDKTNVDIENLTLLSRSELVRMNQDKLFSDDPEQTLLGIMLVRLNHKIMEADLIGDARADFEKYVERAARNGIARETFKARLRRGWSVRNAVNKPLYSRRSS